MKALRCDFCGGNLVMDNSREFATCEHCGTKYMKDTIQAIIQEIRGEVKVVGAVETFSGDMEKERLLKKAKTYEEIGDYSQSLMEYEKMTETFPDDPRAWLGFLMFICNHGLCIHRNQITNNIDALISSYEKYMKIYCKLTTENNLAQYADIMFDNLKNGNLVFSCNNIVYGTIDVYRNKLTAFFTEKQIEKIFSEGYYFADGIVNLDEETSLSYACTEVGNRPMSLNNCVLYFGKWLLYQWIDYEGNNNKYWKCGSTKAKKIPDKKLIDFCGNLRTQRRNSNCCQHCGGRFKGITKKTCKLCGIQKDY